MLQSSQTGGTQESVATGIDVLLRIFLRINVFGT